MAKDDYAIVVGINNYLDLPCLRGAVNDADNFCDWLKNDAGLPSDNIISLCSVNGHASGLGPMRSDIELQFQLLKRKLAGNLARRLYLFFAGHGFTPDARDAALLMSNAGKSIGYPHWPGAISVNLFVRIRAFKEIILIMDCCRSDQLNIQLDQLSSLNWEVCHDRSRQEAKVLTMFAAKYDDVSREVCDSGRCEGVFTKALLAGLRKHGNVITARSLKQYIDNSFYRSNSRPEVHLRPDHPDSDFVVIESAYRPSVLLPPELSSGNDFIDIVRGDTSERFSATDALPLDAGLYEARLEPSHQSIMFEVIGGLVTNFHAVTYDEVNH